MGASGTIPQYRRAIELNPAYHDAMFDLAACYEQLGRNTEAAEWYQRYITAIGTREPANAQRATTALGRVSR